VGHSKLARCWAYLEKNIGIGYPYYGGGIFEAANGLRQDWVQYSSKTYEKKEG
jgi:hypothetical protein